MEKSPKKADITVALVGNPNVGKSSLFNSLTGLNQWVGNWPGKTVEVAEGTLVFKGKRMRIIDLPGTYSLTSFSEEEVVTRDYVLSGEADAIINVIDATSLERNLFLTLQLMEMNAPIIIALNMIDEAMKKGIEVKADALSKLLGVPVIPIVATSGIGITELMEALLSKPAKSKRLTYGKEVEAYISQASRHLPQLDVPYPLDWISIKVLEGDPIITSRFIKDKAILDKLSSIMKTMEDLHGEPPSVVIASERYSLSHRIAQKVMVSHTKPAVTLEDRIDVILSHQLIGYIILFSVLSGTFLLIFLVGGTLSTYIDELFGFLIQSMQQPFYAISPLFASLMLDGVIFGIGAATSIALPYVATFYFLLSMLEDTGYLPRAAFLLDSLMHKIGLHGKAFIPMLLGYGCSVPACIGCRIMETKRERLLLGALVVLIPCSARTVIILGVVASYLGVLVALAIYAFDLVLVFAIGRLLFKILPEEPVGLIMEVPPLRMFRITTVLKKTWVKTKDFVYLALPLIVAGSFVVSLAENLNLVDVIVYGLSPITVWLLGLPVKTGIAFVFGFLRKELALIMLATYVGTTNFAAFMTPAQMITFTLVMVLYIPCIATLSALIKEYGLRSALAITSLDVILALFIGGIGIRVLTALWS
ncbi:MAG: ferrous iron transport protein B [Candidatus Methanomethylicaceae archaeon]